MEELFAISISLFAHDVSEDSDDDIIGDVGGVLDDGVSDEEENSDILEAVAGEEESNTGILDGITEDGLNFFFNSTWVIDGFNVFNQSEEFSFGFSVFGVLGLLKKVRLWVLPICFQF